MTDYDSLEEFNADVDESGDPDCGFCFGLGHFKHLNPAARKLAWLSHTGQEEKRIEYLASELERVKDQPIDDNIFFYIAQAELLNTNNQEYHFGIAKAVLARAHEMVEKKMPAAWVAVRSYAWIRESDLSILPQFLDKTEDMDVWQVVMQCMSARGMNLPDLEAAKNKVHDYVQKAIAMESTTKRDVVVMNGIMAMMRLSDIRALELVKKLPRRKYLDNNIKEQADRIITRMTEKRTTQFIPVLMEIKQVIEQPNAP